MLVSDLTATYTERMIDEDESELFALPPASPYEALVERLRASDAGRDVLALFETHRDECLTLVRARRGFTVAWHRHHGPAWLAALGRSARESIYQLPAEIGGVQRAVAIEEITNALRAEASELLRADIAALREPVGDALATAGTASPGSAMPSICEWTPPLHTCPVNLPCSVASWLFSIRVLTPIERAYSPQRAQLSISAASLLT